jgi:Na+-transporting methylmalonyl-CoA/oxaloacetate decarboxylase gamma subunit
MAEGLFISLVGMGAVFLSLTIIMFLMMGIERVFRDEEQALEEGSGVREGWTIVEPVQRKTVPESNIEVAAVVLALTSYLKERDRDLGTSIAINDVHYHVGTGDISVSPTSVEVNGERFLGAVGGEGLPVIKHTSLLIGPRTRDVGRERIWRLAHPFSIGGYWSRHGWSGRR